MKARIQKSHLVLILILLSATLINAQDKLKKMPGYERYAKIAPQINSSIISGQLQVSWAEDSRSFTYSYNGKKYSYVINKLKPTEIGKADPPVRRTRGNRPARGRQYASAVSPDKKFTAYTKDRNMYLKMNSDGSSMAITTDGNADNQVKYGIATWVYGEELRQNTAMWWSPDNKKIAFYRFDEKNAKKYYLIYNQTKIQDSLEIEAYPKVGAKNLPVDLLVYNLDTKKITKLDVRDGKQFQDGPIGTYIYDIQWSPDGKELLFHSTNRKQDIMEFKAADPETGKTRVIIREEWPDSFTRNSPEIRFLEDGKRFIWASERTGFNNYYLYDISGELLHTLTNHDFEVYGITKVDENRNNLFYTARSGDNHMKMQLHKVRLDGKNNQRLTDPAYNHTVAISPDSKFIVDVAQTHDIPPFTNLLDRRGRKISELAKSDMSKFNALNLKKVEVFTFIAADGITELHGMLHFPSNFDPSKKYPVILSIYGGPATNGFRENFTRPSYMTEFGFLVVNLDGRNVGGRGKRMLDKLYGNLGIVEMDDFAEGIKSLYNRPYFDKNRVGVVGTSYGGTTAATCLLRFPDVFHAAVANSAVTDWRNYDNIYTERYMNLIENNLEGYERSSLMKYAKDLQGDLMIFYGTNDNNVHPANSLQLIQALQRAGKSFEVQVGPDLGHTRVNTDRMMEFFIQNLVLNR